MEATNIFQNTVLNHKDGIDIKTKCLLETLHIASYNIELLADRIEDRFMQSMGRILLVEEVTKKTHEEFEERVYREAREMIREEGLDISKRVETDVLGQAKELM